MAGRQDQARLRAIRKAEALVAGEPKLDNTQQTLDYYSQALALLFQATRSILDSGKVWSSPNVDRGDAIQRSREAWALLRDARVFSFEPHVYAWLHYTADRYTTEVLAGLPFRPPGNEEFVPEDETKKLVDIMFHHSKRVEFPEQWPFDTVFVGFGPGVMVGEADYALRKHYYDTTFSSSGETMIGASVRGLLITNRNEGNVIELADYVFRMPSGEVRTAMIPEWYRSNGTWARSYSLTPWIVQNLCWLLNSYRKFVEETKHTLASRYRARDQVKKFASKRETAVGWLPRPYYVVRMKPEILEEITRSPSLGPAYRYTYRFDVRGHERVRIRRGWLPLDPKVDEGLRERGYKVYTGEIEDADLKKLFARHVPPKRVNEWVAVLTTWVDSYQKGPENAAYIPAVRVPAPGHEPC